MAMIDRNFTFATNGTVTANDLHNLIDSATIYQDLITGQQPITSVGTNYELLIADGTNPNAAPNAVTVYDLFEDALTAGTYTNANISAALTYGTATGTRLVSTNATITTGTITTGVIPTLTAGTTTSTAATITSGTVTNLASTTGTIATLNSTTGTVATLNSTTGTIATLVASAGTFAGSLVNVTNGTVATLNSTTGTITGLNTTTGTIATLNSTTGTITNLSTTLAGDFTISQGTGTVGTSKITFPMLSTSGTEADNVAKRTARAWVRFNGAGTVAITASFNVSSITDNATGDYTANFTIAMADANYAVVGSAGVSVGGNAMVIVPYITAPSTSSIRFVTTNVTVAAADFPYVSLYIFGN